MARKDASAQKVIDWRRCDQLAALRLARLPAVTLREGARGVVVPASRLILVLRVIDDHGNPCWASAETLAAESHLSPRTVFRALAALSGQGEPPLAILAVGKRRAGVKGWVNTYAIVWPELAPWCGDRTATVPDRSAMATDRSAMATDRTATSGRQSVPSSAPRSAPSSDVLRGDGDGDEERFFSAEDLAAIRRLGNELAAWMPVDRLDNRELAAKLATLRHDGLLSEDDWQDLLESFAVKREQRQLPRNAAAWIWGRLRSRLGEGQLERLLAGCRYPRELMPAVVSTEGKP